MDLSSLLAVSIPLIGIIAAVYSTFVLPTQLLVGHFRTVSGLNNGHCRAISGLAGCENQYMDHHSGLLYVACISPEIRQHWTPALNLMDHRALPKIAPGYFALYNTQTGELNHLRIEGELEYGLHPHGFDLFVSPPENDSGFRKATLFAVNHKVPNPRFSSPTGKGADSVIEVFETWIGSNVLRHIKTLQDSHIITPNSILALSHSTFYVTNDHAKKTGFYRNFAHYGMDSEIAFGFPTSTIAFCDCSQRYFSCSMASYGLLYPNGLAQGPESTIYVASTALGIIWHLGMQTDHSLVVLKTIDVGRIIDNIHVLPTGAILAATIPIVQQFTPAVKSRHRTSAVEVYRISNGTTSSDYFGSVEHVELIFADDGKIASTVTDAQQSGSRLYLSGIATESVLECEIAE